MAVFRRCQIVLDLTTSVKFKDKSQLRKDITSNGGIVSFIVTKKSTHVVCSDPEKADISYKCQMAAKFGLPVVSIQWINQCVQKGTLLDTDDFLVVGKSRSERLKEGKISATRFQKKEKKKTVKPFINVNKFKVWTPDDNDCPLFSPDIQLAKYAVLIDEKRYKKNQTFTVLEVHVDEQFSAGDSVYEYKYRVVSHSGSVCLVERGDPGCFEYRFCSNIDEVLTVYSFLYKQEQQHGMTLMHNNFPQNIGSEKFRMVVGELGVECGTMVEEVEDLVELIWHEALGELESILSVPVSNIKMEQIEKAEAVLKQIKSAVDCEDTSKIAQLMADFYKELPLEKRDVGDDSLNMKAWISRKNDTCQLVKDMISVCEATNWSLRSSTESKYRALRCVIDCLSKSSCEYDRVEQHIKSSLSDYEDSSFKVQAIYAVNRPLENVNFMSELPNRQELFHASKVDNIVGILSRGLLMPKVVVDDHGGVRSDPGMLGSGIYFASSASTSVQYSTPSKMKGSRFMLVCEVALGNTKEMYMKDLSLTSPPEGYQSVHGMKCTDCMKSEFKNDEFVVYETAQQRIKYLVEFTTYSDVIKDVDLGVNIDNQDDIDDDDIELLNLTDVKDIVDPMSKVKAGLVSKDDAPVHLKCVHIRAKLMDLASEVVVLQEYQNNSESPLEAKYVCPLSDMAAVCGFEAFINGKHIVGEVKEKETAHKEYKKAISEGHGAYLMDQDEETPDVFTVSVGNLPSGACVLIKITYVTELQAEGDMISFRLPGSVAPWKKDSLKEETQIVTDTYEVKQGETSVQVSIDMPFDIRSIECPTHKIKSKRTLSKATVEMLPNQSITDGFQLYIGLAEIHVPRMWVERKPGDTDHQACMLTFYPQFEACESDDVGVILMLDLSNSMKGDNLISAKKILLLTLQKLPPSFNFNIVVFGTAWLELFPTCTKNTTANRKLASEFVQSVSASMGNTEMVHPMHSLYLLKPDSYVQNVFIISDGHLNNPDFMLKSARENSQHTRIFTFGISSTANRHLLRTLARAAAGAFEFFDSKAKSKWEGKVKSQIHRAAQPGLTSVKVDWEQHGDDVASPVQAPSQITALFNGSRSVIYGYVPNCTMATLTAHIGSDEVSTMVSTSDVSITEGLILHRLTAKAIIDDWEDGVLSPDRTDHEILKMNTKNFIIELSKEYSIVTQFTSFVAIEKRDEDEEQYAVDAPTMGELIELENVDQLQYMEYKEDEVIQLHEPLPDYEEDEEMDDLYECFDDVYDDVIEESCKNFLGKSRGRYKGKEVRSQLTAKKRKRINRSGSTDRSSSLERSRKMVRRSRSRDRSRSNERWEYRRSRSRDRSRSYDRWEDRRRRSRDRSRSIERKRMDVRRSRSRDRSSSLERQKLSRSRSLERKKFGRNRSRDSSSSLGSSSSSRSHRSQSRSRDRRRSYERWEYRSRSRDRSRSPMRWKDRRSRSRDRSGSIEREKFGRSRSRDRSRSLERTKDVGRRSRSRDRSRSLERTRDVGRRSRSRDRSRSLERTRVVGRRSRSRDKSRSIERTREVGRRSRSRDRSRSLERTREVGRRSRSRDRSRSLERTREVGRRSRSRDRSRSLERTREVGRRSRSRDRSRSLERSREVGRRSRSRDRSRSFERTREVGRRSRSRDRSRSLERTREVGRRSRSRDRSRSLERTREVGRRSRSRDRSRSVERKRKVVKNKSRDRSRSLERERFGRSRSRSRSFEKRRKMARRLRSRDRSGSHGRENFSRSRSKDRRRSPARWMDRRTRSRDRRRSWDRADDKYARSRGIETEREIDMSAPQEICDADISLLGMSMEEKPEEVKALVEENEHYRKFSRSALKSTRKQGPPSGGWQQETADSSMGGGISPVTKSPVQLLEIQSADMCLAEAKMFEPMAEMEMMIATPLMADEALTRNWEEKNYEAVESFSAKSLENSVSPKFAHHEESSDDDMGFSLFDDDAVSDSSEEMEEEGKKGKRAPTSRRGISITAPARPDPFIVTGEKTDKMKKPTSERLGKKVDVSPPPRLALAAAPQLKALMHHQLEGQQQQQSLELSHQKRQSAIAESISSMIPRRGRRRGKMDSRQTILQFPDSAPSKQPFMQTKSHLRSSAFSPTSPAYSPTSPGYSPTSPSYSPSTPQLDQEIYSVSLCSAQLPPQAPPPPPPPHQPPIRTYSAYQADGYSGARFYSCISPPHQEPPIRGGKPQPGGALFGSRPPPPEPSQSSFGGVSHIDLLSTEPQPLSRSPISFSFGGKRSKNVPLQLSAFDSAEARYSYTPSAPPLPPQTISAPPPPPPPPSDLAPPPPLPSNLAPPPLHFGSSAPPPKMIPTHPTTDLLQHSAPTILAKRKKKSVVLKEKETAECFDKQSAMLVSSRTVGSKEVSKPKAEVLLDETDLCMYGIGVNIPSILKTSVMELKDVSTVINMQNNFGTWVMDSKLQDLLCVNFDVCKTVLNKAGLRSLGIKCYDEIIEMISTTVVLLCIVKCVIPDIFPINFRLDGAVQYLLTKLNDMLESKKRSKHMPPQSNVMATFSSAMHFCEKIDLMYPLVCSQLELGQHWTEFVGKMLQLHSTEGGNTFDLDSAGTRVSKDAPLVQNVNVLECSLLI